MLDHFFIFGPAPGNAEYGHYNVALIFASYAIASIASYTGLTFAIHHFRAVSRREKALLHWGGALALGCGIWSMHFIGMLAYKMQPALDYAPGLTALSLMIAVGAAYSVVSIAGAPHLSAKNLLLASLLLGGAISGMHYTGMAAMQMDGVLYYRPVIFALSLAIAVIASAAALRIILYLRNPRSIAHEHILRVVAALVMGVAICGMHYTGMKAAVFIPFANCRYAPDQSFDTLAFIVVLITSFIMAISLLLLIYARGGKSSAENDNPFPVQLLSLTALLKLGAMIWIIGYSMYSDYILKNGVADDKRIALLVARMNDSDAHAASALRHGVMNHDHHWDIEYHDAELQLADSLNEIEAHYPNPAVREKIHEAMRASEQVGVIRHHIISLVNQGDYSQARLLYERNDYLARDSEHAATLDALRDSLENISTQGLSVVSQYLHYMTYVTILIGGILLVATYFSLSSVFRWRRELRVTRQKLMKALGQAEASNAAKSEFLANMSHELRTPLNSILGMMRLLRESKLDETQAELAGTVSTASATLLMIVNDILDLSKIEANEMGLEKIGMDIPYIVHSVLDYLQHVANEKHLDLTAEVTPLPYVLGDPTRLTQILANLVGNAIKYTDKGHVKIEVSTGPLTTEQIAVTCRVTDSGIGIPLEKQVSVFDKFTQADSSTTRRFGGTGLGLAITKNLVELMGGVIGVESNVGEGSIFWFRIPFAITDELEPLPHTRIEPNSCGTLPSQQARVLIAEDHKLNQQLVTRLMIKFGIGHYSIVENGLEALAQLERNTWDLILMDCHMPNLNGYETTLAIRKSEQEAGVISPIPIIAMTANAMRGDREKCLRVGMNEYISKPIDIDELKLVMGQWIRFAPEAELQIEAAPQGPQRQEPSDGPIDLIVLKNFSVGNLELERELASTAIDQCDINLAQLKDSCIDGVSQAWYEAAHMLKGGAGGMGAKMLSQLANKAQQMLEASATDRQRMLAAIASEYEKVHAYFISAGLLDVASREETNEA